MVALDHSLTYEIEPIPPYDFNLTIRKPAGWPLFTPLKFTVITLFGQPYF